MQPTSLNIQEIGFRLGIKGGISALVGLGRTLVTEPDLVAEILKHPHVLPAAYRRGSATGLSVTDEMLPRADGKAYRIP
jgi:hypothetical protein